MSPSLILRRAERRRKQRALTSIANLQLNVERRVAPTDRRRGERRLAA